MEYFIGTFLTMFDRNNIKSPVDCIRPLLLHALKECQSLSQTNYSMIVSNEQLFLYVLTNTGTQLLFLYVLTNMGG